MVVDWVCTSSAVRACAKRTRQPKMAEQVQAARKRVMRRVKTRPALGRTFGVGYPLAEPDGLPAVRRWQRTALWPSVVQHREVTVRDRLCVSLNTCERSPVLL